MGLETLGPRDYDEYVKHQASKLGLLGDQSLTYGLRHRMILRQRLERLGFISSGMSVLCLGARLGQEVRAFIDHGCFAVGMDLNPGEGNRFVVHGDFHQIQFATDSVEVIFTNSVDHAFNLNAFIDEVRRVLKPNGFLVMDVARGRAEGLEPEAYEALWWERIDDLLDPFLANEFDVLCRDDFDWPWLGQHVVLKAGR